MNYAQKVQASLDLLASAHEEHGSGLVVAHSMGKDSAVVWDLARRVNLDICGFVVTTRFKPDETVAHMNQVVGKSRGKLQVFSSDVLLPERLHETNPDQCCHSLKVVPVRRALEELGATAWITGLRATEGRTRRDYQPLERDSGGLAKVNPLLTWEEREVWQYLALNQVPVNPLYHEGFRSLGCAPCTQISEDGGERGGRWIGTSKCGGECGIHSNGE
jgi:phosphoadenosine phosphosulfate reductase